MKIKKALLFFVSGLVFLLTILLYVSGPNFIYMRPGFIMYELAPFSCKDRREEIIEKQKLGVKGHTIVSPHISGPGGQDVIFVQSSEGSREYAISCSNGFWILNRKLYELFYPRWEKPVEETS